MNLFQVNLFVKSFPEMLRFYRNTLGFEVNDIEPGPPSVPLVNWHRCERAASLSSSSTPRLSGTASTTIGSQLAADLRGVRPRRKSSGVVRAAKYDAVTGRRTACRLPLRDP